MGRCGQLCGVIAIVVLAAIALPLAQKYRALRPDEPFALMTTHNATQNPPNFDSRYRGAEYRRSDRFFFQWWNYLVFDGETRDHWNLIYQITEFSDKFELRTKAGGAAAPDLYSEASTSMAHFTGAEFKTAGGDTVPLSDLSIQNQWGMHMHKSAAGKAAPADNKPNRISRPASTTHATTPREAVLSGIPYQQNVIDDDTYHILATIPATRSATGVEIEWDLTFKRVHGVYGSTDSEEASRGDTCLMLSTLFGYHSEVWGTIREGKVVHTITRTPRYRAYAAGSWGCTLPGGTPPVEYPWVWFWLIVPGPVPAQDLSFTWGGATLQAPAIGTVNGLTANSAVHNVVVSARKARIFGGTAFEFPLQTSTSDGYVSKFSTTRGDWAEFKDRYGRAMIPLSQTFYLQTENHNFTLAFTSRVEQYFRAPVYIESTGPDGRMKMFSDFRGVGVHAHILIHKRDPATNAWSVLYDVHTDSMNAIEYAYEAELEGGYTPLSAWQQRFTPSKDGKM